MYNAQCIKISETTNMFILNNAYESAKFGSDYVVSENTQQYIIAPGGNSPKDLLRLISTKQSVPLTVLPSDERLVENSHNLSNYRMIADCFLSNNLCKVHNIFDPQFSNEQMAEKYSLHLSHITHIDIAILGLGSDGHIASLFPNDKYLKNIKLQPNAYSVTKDGIPRCSISMRYLLGCKQIILYVTGKEKKDIVRHLTEKSTTYTLPVDILKNNSSRLTIITDKEAVT